MVRSFLADAARRDIVAILAWSQEHFGADARLRYEALLARAISDLAENPNRAGSQDRPDIASNAKTYHISHSRSRVSAASRRVKRPRHLLLYRVKSRGHIEISRVLHESMDLPRHLPREYRLIQEDDPESGR